MPITQEQIGTVEKMVDDVIEIINEEIHNYKEEACEEDKAEFVVCSECVDDVICINEDVLPMGTCMNCGHVNNIYQCEICFAWFNIDEGECMKMILQYGKIVLNVWKKSNLDKCERKYSG